MFKKLLSMLLYVMVISIGINAQGVIYGTVTDAGTGETIPGATVLIEEINRGIATDADGKYRLTGVPSGDYKVTFSFVGFKSLTLDVQVGSSEVLLNANLEATAIGLDELVVSGYAITPKRELTGSISSVTSKDIQDVSLQNTQSILQGRAAGVTVSATSGNPGAAFKVQIRGNGSINAVSEPLYIVDGVQIDLGNTSGLTSTTPLNAINPNDIESLEVLKDAAAAAIYGSQAASGVVIITTKSGTSGATRVNAKVERGVRSLARNVDYINSDQYVEYMGEASALNFGIDPTEGYTSPFAGDTRTFEAGDYTPFEEDYRSFFLSFFGADPDSDPANPTLTNTDWQDFIFSEGITEKYDLSVSGGNQTTRYYLSGGFEDTEGTAYGSDFVRTNIRTRLDHQINSDLSTGMNISVSRATQFGVCQDGNFINCPPSQAMFEAPMSFPYLADGSYNPNTRFGLSTNPAVVDNEVDRNVVVSQVIGSANFLYKINDWLNAKVTASVDYRNTQDEQYRSAIAAPTQNGFITFANRNLLNTQTNIVVNGVRTFDEVHNVSGLVGAEYKRVYSETQATRGDNISGPFFSVLNSTSTPITAAGSNTEYRVGSYFTNLKYNYDSKYFFSFTGRYDGHSRFGADERWAFFPSVSGAWQVSEESFFDGVDVLDDLKLRVGYGQTGNSAIGNFNSLGLFSIAGTYDGSTAIAPTQLANGALTWEQKNEINVGLDFAMFNNRFRGSVDVYQQQSDNLLFGRPLPTDSGFGSITENIGKIQNEGLELELSSTNYTNRDFNWTSRFNIAFVRNEILELPEGEDIGPSSSFQSLQIGKPIGLIQVPRWAGVNPADGRPMWLDQNGEITYTPQTEDNIEYKDGVADAVGGFGNTLSYKGLSLDAFFQFSFGQWAFPSTDYYFTRTPDFLMNLTTEVLDRWQTPGDLTHYPRAIEGGNDYAETDNYRVTVGTQSIYNASYIRLKNVSLSYNLPTSLISNLGIRNVRLYASAINLATWTAWPYYDPEVAFSPFDIYTNVTTASYPTEKQIYGGIDISF